MLRRTFFILTTAAAATLAGCATRPASQAASTAAPSTMPSTKPSGKSELSLNEILPIPAIPEPTTQPSGPPSLDALELYARARRAMIENQRYNAVGLLEKALELDPFSFALRKAVADAYVELNNRNDRALQSMESAAALAPQDLETRTDLGKLLLIRGEIKRAIEQLRMATQTEGYASDEQRAAVVDFLLARALQQEGYDRAALDQYSILLKRLRQPWIDIHDIPDLAAWISSPEQIELEIARLDEKRGDLRAALNIYQQIGNRVPDNLEMQARIARLEAQLGTNDSALAAAAKKRAGDVVRRSRANPESIALLKDVYAKVGGGDVRKHLEKLWRENPADQSILLALVQFLRDEGKVGESEELLGRAVEQSDWNWELVTRLFHSYDERDATKEAALLLVRVTDRKPQLVRQLSPMWSSLLRNSRANSLRLSDLQGWLAKSPTPAGNFWVGWLATTLGRETLAKSSMNEALSAGYAPAYRLALRRIWSRQDSDVAKKLSDSELLVDRARGTGESALAAELHATALFNAKKYDESIAAFDSIEPSTKPSAAIAPDRLLTEAAALRAKGNRPLFEKEMWKVLSDWPGLEEGYETLFHYYLEDARDPSKAASVLQAWGLADPRSTHGQLLRANLLAQTGSANECDVIIRDLLKRRPQQLDVLGVATAIYIQSGRTQQWIEQLNALHKSQPKDLAIVETLVQLYVEAKRLNDSWQLLEESRTGVASDPDLLFYLSHLYSQSDQKEVAEQVMEQVLQVDPQNVPASNDLGYNWADEGRNLGRAETLIRHAVDAEPDNQSFLDSLGWVLYKRSQFSEAADYFQRALGDDAGDDDPVVLDHLADTLWQLKQSDQAKQNWKRSLERLGDANESRQDLKNLRLQLQTKLRQADAGQTVNVAPVAETPTSRPAQAKG